MISASVWCRCGASLVAHASPIGHLTPLVEEFRRIHSAEGCQISDNAALGARWRAAARRREVAGR